MAPKKRLSIEEIVRRKDKQLRCPHCWAQMRYKKVTGTVAKWSPAPYAWFCDPCDVVIHDGSIDQSEQTLHSKIKEEEASRISSYLSSVLKKAYKKDGPEN